MPNDAGLPTVPYTDTALATSVTVVVQVLKATRIVALSPRMLFGVGFSPLFVANRGGLPVALADGAVVTATRQDAGGSATGEVVNDDRGIVWAVFPSAIAAGRWSLAV
jgi:hypothetical protein